MKCLIILSALAVSSLAADHKFIPDPNGSGATCAVIVNIPDTYFCPTKIKLDIKAKIWNTALGLDTVSVKPDTTKGK